MHGIRRVLRTMFFFTLAAAAANAQDLAVSVGTWSFYRGSDGNYESRSPGVFASIGATAGIGPRIEAGVSLVPRFTPEPFDDIFVEGHVGASLFGDRVARSGNPSIYINALADLGVLFGAHNVHSGSPDFSGAIFLRITPVAIGNPYYFRRDRLYSAGLLYDWNASAISLFVNVIASDFFLAPRFAVR